MHPQSAIQNETLTHLLLLASRLLLAWIFVHEGIFVIANFDSVSAAMAELGVPPIALMATCALQLGAGLAIATGWQTRWGAFGLGLFCIATAVMFHTNFANRNELLQFEKDLAIAGGMFGLMVCGAGRWSIEAMWKKDAA